MSKVKAGGSSKNLKDSPGQRLGVKAFGGQTVERGAIIVRQRGMSKVAGNGTKLGKDFTIFATQPGTVRFEQTTRKRFSGARAPRTRVIVE